LDKLILIEKGANPFLIRAFLFVSVLGLHQIKNQSQPHFFINRI